MCVSHTHEGGRSLAPCLPCFLTQRWIFVSYANETSGCDRGQSEKQRVESVATRYRRRNWKGVGFLPTLALTSSLSLSGPCLLSLSPWPSRSTLRSSLWAVLESKQDKIESTWGCVWVSQQRREGMGHLSLFKKSKGRPFAKQSPSPPFQRKEKKKYQSLPRMGLVSDDALPRRDHTRL